MLGIPLQDPRRRASRDFDPLAFSPLLWLDGSKGMFTDTAGTMAAGVGDSVALWKDQSGNGRDATQANATRQGIKTSEGVILTLGGYLTTLNLLRPFTIIVVERPTVGGNQLRTIQSGTSNCLMSAGRGDLTAFLNGPVGSYPSPEGQVAVLELTASGTAPSKLVVNGVERTGVMPASTDWGPFAIGSAGTQDERPATTIMQIYVATQLSDSERAHLRVYFNEKAGLPI